MIDFVYLSPEIVLFMVWFLVFLGTLFKGQSTHIIWTCIVGTLSAVLQLFLSFRAETKTIFYDLFYIDGYSFLSRISLLFFSLLTYFWILYRHKRGRLFEQADIFFVSALTSYFSLLFITKNLILFFISITFFVIAEQKQKAPHFVSSYLFKNGTVCVSLFLISVLCLGYWNNGNLDILSIHKNLSQETRSVLFFVIIYLFAVGFFAGMFPFVLYVFRVFSILPYYLITFLTYGFALTSITLVFRLIGDHALMLPENGDILFYSKNIGGYLKVVSALTSIAGFLAIMRYKSIQSLLAGLWITEMGLLLLSIVNAHSPGISVVLLHLFVMSLSFLAFVYLVFEHLDAKRNFSLIKNKWSGVLYFVAICAALGLPPFPGFFTRFLILSEAVKGELLINTIVYMLTYFSFGFVLVKIIKAETFNAAVKKIPPERGMRSLALPAFSLFIVVLITPFFGVTLELIRKFTNNIFW